MGLEIARFLYLIRHSYRSTRMLPRTFIPVFMGHYTFQSTNSISLQKSLPYTTPFIARIFRIFLLLYFRMCPPIIDELKQAKALVSNMT